MLRGIFQGSYSVNFSISNVHMDAFGMASTFSSGGMLIRNAMVEADESSRCLFPSFYFSSPIADRKHCISFIIIDNVSILRQQDVEDNLRFWTVGTFTPFRR